MCSLSSTVVASKKDIRCGEQFADVVVKCSVLTIKLIFKNSSGSVTLSRGEQKKEREKDKGEEIGCQTGRGREHERRERENE